MATSPLFTLTPDIIALATNGVDQLILQLGKPCLLLFTPTLVFCNNCVYDSFSKRSSNVYITGANYPFARGTLCPLCNGVGTKETQVTKTVTLLIHTDPKKWVTKLPPNVEIGAGMIETKGFLSDLPSVMQAQEMIVQPDLSPYIKWKYRMASEPENRSNIVQARYWTALWSRIG